MKLQKLFTNDLFKAIKAAEFNPRDFSLVNGVDEVRITNLHSPSYFLLNYSQPVIYKGTYVVGDIPLWPYEVYSWHALMERVSGWLVEVKRDVETPDLWAELQREAKLLTAGPDESIENMPFTPDEQEEIAGIIRELSDYARRTYSLPDTQILALNANVVDYGVEAASRLGRNDWRNAVAWTLFAYALDVALPQEAARGLLLSLLGNIAHFYAQGFQALTP